MTADRYTHFAALVRDHHEGMDFAVAICRGWTGVTVLAPHGGRIEPGSSEIARALAAGRHNLYDFRGLKSKGNRVLHLKSEHFDEPRALQLIAASRFVIVVHGCAGEDEGLYLGGRAPHQNELARTLAGQGWKVAVHPRFRGRHRDNLCNRLGEGRGLQLEASAGLRRRLLSPEEASGAADLTLTRLAGAVNRWLDRWVTSAASAPLSPPTTGSPGR